MFHNAGLTKASDPAGGRVLPSGDRAFEVRLELKAAARLEKDPGSLS
jgi:hypothetical protein